MSAAREARRFLRARRAAVLSTLSTRLPGYPFGSVAPFVADHAARPVVLVSALAEHTRNLAADARASLLVQEAADDVQAAARLTVIGDAIALASDDPGAQRYLRMVPGADRLLALGDFSFRAIAPRALLFVRGFGRIDWVDAEAYAPPQNGLEGAEPGILAHMNDDHADTLRLYCAALAGVAADAAVMVGVDCEGFDVRAGERVLRFEFDAPALDAEAVRTALVALAARARGR